MRGHGTYNRNVSGLRERELYEESRVLGVRGMKALTRELGAA